jgi:transcriptional regulator with XRE-family HTH domain
LPARPRELTALEPKRRPPGIPDELWALPRRVAEAGRRRKLSQEILAKRSGLAQSTVSRLLSYIGLERMRVSTLISIERALKVRPGWLTSSDPVPFVDDEEPQSETRPRSSNPPDE